MGLFSRVRATTAQFHMAGGFLASLGLRHKIALALGLTVLLVTSILGYVALNNVAKLGEQLESVNRDAIQPLWQVEKGNKSLHEMRIVILSAINPEGSRQQGDLTRAAKYGQEFTAALDKYDKEFTLGGQPVMRNLLSRHGALKDQNTREQNALQTVNRDYPLLKSAIERIIGLVTTGKNAEANALYNSHANALFGRLDESTITLIKLQVEQGDYSLGESDAVLAATKWQLGGAVLVALLTGFTMASVLSGMVIRPIRELISATQEVAKGNLTQVIPVQSRDEIGELAFSFNQMSAALKRTRSELARDIAARNRIEAELKANDLRLTQAQQIGSWEWDIVENKILWSDELYRIFGLQPQESGRTYEGYFRYVHPDDVEIVTECVEQALRDKKFPSYSHRIVRPDGTERVIQAYGVVIVDDDGNPIRMTGAAQDITERKRIEADLERALDAALDSARTKSEFLANMSHEIRTPLNGVIGMTGLLLNTKLTQQQRRYAETASRSGESLLMTINDILDFSKIEAGKMRLETIDFDLETVLENVAGILAERAQTKNIELAVSIHRQLPTALKGDPFRLSQILTNLATNAVKFTEQGEVVLRAKRIEETGSAIVIRFEVSDTGIGIAPEQQARLFQSFSQADSSTTRKYGGTGLGLVICAQIVQLMGGEIGVESEAGKGSLFWFTVPLAKSSAGAQNNPPCRTDLVGLRVLIVDDNATNRFILNEQIVSWQMRNGSADGGVRALELLQAAAGEGEPYGLVILDMQMPEMDGLTLARAIKADPRTAPAVLILLTSMSLSGIPDEASEAGIAACLSKPVRQSELYDCMVEVMGLRPVTLTPAAQAAAPSPAATIRMTAARSNIRILVAEDNIVNQEVALGMLEAEGYRADTVANGREAVEAAGRTRYAAVLMDCQMPEMDGYAAASEIRKREGVSRRTPIIAMTAHALEGEREKCLAAGMDDYLSKPVRPEELYAALERWIPSTVPAAADDSLDFTILDNIRKLQRPGGPDLLARVIGLFLQDTPSRLGAVREVVSQGHARDLARLAHALKGSSANLGARGMVRMCAELEALGNSEEIGNAAGVLANLEAEFGSVRAALETRVQG